MSKSVSGYLKTKKNQKVLWPLSPRGGGKASMVRPLRKELFFFAASLKELAQKTNKQGNFIKKTDDILGIS